MTSEKMAKAAAGVHRRAGSTNWQWRIKTPLDLASVYASQWAHRCSLETSELRLANTLAAQLQATWTARFEDQRRTLNPQRVEHVTSEMGKLLAERVRARILGMAEKLRSDPETARILVEAMQRGLERITYPAISILEVFSKPTITAAPKRRRTRATSKATQPGV